MVAKIKMPEHLRTPRVLSKDSPMHYAYQVLFKGEPVDMNILRYADVGLGMIVMLKIEEGLPSGGMVMAVDREHGVLKSRVAYGKVEIKPLPEYVEAEADSLAQPWSD